MTPERGSELTIEIAPADFAIKEFINHHYVGLYTSAELLVVNKIRQVVGKSRATAGLTDDNLQTLLDIMIEISKGFFALAFGLAQKTV